MSRSLFENIVFVCIAAAIGLSEPAIRPAQAEEDYHFLNFTAPIPLSRGTLDPTGEGALTLEPAEACRLANTEWGWGPGECDTLARMVVGGDKDIDTLLIEKPADVGYVDLGDWSDGDGSIERIWDSFSESMRAQSARIHKNLKPIRWYIRPTVDRDKQYLLYAVLLEWDGEPIINVKATKFDRYGYIVFSVVPRNSDISPVDLKAAVERAMGSYHPKPEAAYTSYISGDKVAAVGAAGVLATLLGVKYGKAAAAGVFAVALIFIKKLGFVLLVLPVLLLKKLFRRT